MTTRWRWILTAALALEILAMSTACRAPDEENAADNDAANNAAMQDADDEMAEGEDMSAAAADTLFFMVDMVQGSHNIPDEERASTSCVMNSRYPRNSEVVWRARIFHPVEGEIGEDMIESAEVTLGNGDVVELGWGAHPRDDPNAEWYWTGSWVVPEDQPTGTLGYSVQATSTDGLQGEFEPFNVESSLLTITEEVMENIEEEES